LSVEDRKKGLKGGKQQIHFVFSLIKTTPATTSTIYM